jgi:tRNA1(Val) A37 N6-methylase TrmN6
MKLDHFKHNDLLTAIKKLFVELNVPMNYLSDEPVKAESILKDTFKDNETFALIDEVYFAGMIDDAAFKGHESPDIRKQEKDYDGILVFGLTLHSRKHNLLPTRSQLAEISRAFNREFKYTPVVLIFKYHDAGTEYLALANTERLAYQQSWREGEKTGKVSLLRDINIHKPHRGHQDIINELQIPASGIKIVDSFEKLYTYWQDVFSVSILNKKFYKELSNWYFWAIKHVTFPNKPTQEMAVEKGTDLNDLIYEHNATNIIRLLTRLLFVWFIKEKKLIPEELFDLRTLQNNILNELTPCNESSSLFEQKNYNSVYYKAILQNLFFASLNCPLNPDDTDKRSRQFRGDESYGKHRGVDWMMRYKKYFKEPDAFLCMINNCVPFLNGGLFECLDDKNQNFYIDGFSDNMTQGEELIVPDYLFFGHEEITDLSEEYGFSNKSTKQAPVKGLIQILNSYKFTITENTPIEEDVALDPELLGKVFENLLASYNPETKTTARKQTGSFYTPREIVNYMVDESLIAYLNNSILENRSGAFLEFGKSQLGLFADITDSGQIKLYENQKHEFEGKEKELDKLLHDLVSFDPGNPFKEFPEASRAILEALDKCKILDPACGSGAFPMGILQKMVHVLQKLDPENVLWKELQLHKALQESEEAYEIADKNEREQKLIEINNAFDVNINDPDYARKLYLIENCIYGVDIQPIASQISKLRFFISLVVDQKVNKKAENFGIRPLPNLETKFVTANTLIGIEKPDIQVSLFETQTIKELEQELKAIRHKLFSAKTKETKLKYREKDKELRNAIAEELKRSGWQNEAAEKLSSWDPYDQNASSPFFDPEWMFDINDGFDIVIGNPPYVESRNSALFPNDKKEAYQKSLKLRWGETGKIIPKGSDLLIYFFEFSLKYLKSHGINTFITQNAWLSTDYGKKFQEFLLLINTNIKIDDSNIKHFCDIDGPNINTVISFFENGKQVNWVKISTVDIGQNKTEKEISNIKQYRINDNLLNYKWGTLFKSPNSILQIFNKLEKKGSRKGYSVGQGLNISQNCIIPHAKVISTKISSDHISPIMTSEDGAPFVLNSTKNYIIIKKLYDKDISFVKDNGYDITKLTNRRKTPSLIMPRGLGRYFCAFNNIDAYSTSGVEVYVDNLNSKLFIWAFMNSTIGILIREITGRTNLGGGMLKAEATDLKYFALNHKLTDIDKIKCILEKTKNKQSKKIKNLLEERTTLELNKIVFNYLEINDKEAKIFNEYLIKLITTREYKAKRINN